MTNSLPIIRLKEGRDRSIKKQHPWVFSGAIKEIIGNPDVGDTVQIVEFNNTPLAIAAFSPHSQIAGRVWSFDASEKIDVSFFEEKIKQAFAYRQKIGLSENNAYRLIHAESDGLPGIIVDKFNDGYVIQILSAGAEKWKDTIFEILKNYGAPNWIYEKSTDEVRNLENLPLREGFVFGQTALPIEIVEDDIKYYVNFEEGQKTGFYNDQRENRKLLRSFVKDKTVLDCFSYTGGFSLNALSAGAKSVISIDSSQEALDILRQNIELNHLPSEKSEIMQEDVFKILRKFRDQAKSFDVIILDPPKFAPTNKHVTKAARAYKDINLLAFKLLNPGGTLFTFSCSGGVDAKLFQQIISGAALDASVNAYISNHMSQSACHPISLNFPEGEYLKGLVCHKM